MMWDLNSGLETAREVERELAALNAHVSLGGGVMLRGESDKDLDLFIYPHDSSMPLDHEAILNQLADKTGLSREHSNPLHSYTPDTKVIWILRDELNRRVDVFFLS